MTDGTKETSLCNYVSYLMFLEALIISLIRGTPRVMFMDATPAKWKVFRVIWVPGSPMLWAHRAPTAEPGSIWALCKYTLTIRNSSFIKATNNWSLALITQNHHSLPQYKSAHVGTKQVTIKQKGYLVFFLYISENLLFIIIKYIIYFYYITCRPTAVISVFLHQNIKQLLGLWGHSIHVRFCLDQYLFLKATAVLKMAYKRRFFLKKARASALYLMYLSLQVSRNFSSWVGVMRSSW